MTRKSNTLLMRPNKIGTAAQCFRGSHAVFQFTNKLAYRRDNKCFKIYVECFPRNNEENEKLSNY